MFDRLKTLMEFSKLLTGLKNGASNAMIQQTGLGAVASLESKFEEYYGYKYGLSFSSATNAITAVVDCLNLVESEVITSPFNYYSSLGGLFQFRNTIVFVDTHDDLTISPEEAERAITKKTKAILAVDFAGNPHDMFGIRKLCDDYDLIYIADASQSFGAKCKNIPASSMADVLVVSLTTGKTLSAGEGAVILMNDFDLYSKLLHYTHPLRIKIELGLSKHPEMIFINGRINPFTAILADQYFELALKDLAKKQRRCIHYAETLKAYDFILPEIKGTSTYFYQFAYSQNGTNTENIEELQKSNPGEFVIESALPFYPVYKLPSIENKYYSQIRFDRCKKVDEYLRKMVFIKSLK